ncbi:hypothetical protein MKY41_06100 [Sporosarcina sp. FSL W7-1349]|uniref:hypothetical protein n=1 Tax=Sporosarcina sp. FSL W7-1349 TaxID=2921561 RepID=UPI0030F96B6A
MNTHRLDGQTVILNDLTQTLNVDAVKEITLALCDRQEETDAMLESMSMDLHKIHGDIAGLKEHAGHVKSELSPIKGELAFMSHKTHRNEAAIFKLRRGYDEGFGDLED